MVAREEEALVAAQSFSGASNAEPCRWIGRAASSRTSHPPSTARQPASRRCGIGGTDVLGGGCMIAAVAFLGIGFGRWAVVGCHAGRLGASAAPPADAVVESGVALRQPRLWNNVAFTRAPGSWQPWKTTQARQVRALRWQPKAFRQALSLAWEGARVWPACETHTPHHRAAGSRCDSCRGVGIGL